MNTSNPANAQAKIISGLCIFVLGCILGAGLWPFHIPRNAVSWLRNKNGLRFSKHSAAVSASAFPASRRPDETGFSLEIDLTPARTIGGGTILAFDSSPDPRAPFKLSQFGSGVAVQRYSVDDQGTVHLLWFKVPHVFEADKRALLVITSSKHKTDLYLNGVLAGTALDPGIASRELTGRLVLGNSTHDDSWNGEIDGLAIYGEELTAAQVNSQFFRGMANQNPPESGEPLLALYRFDEQQGNTIHNQIDPATDLIIPARYFVLHKLF
jgi:Concanavalin A-like lectin/glucanases superfamily